MQVDTWGFEKGRHEGAQITHAGYCSSTHGGRHHKKNNIYLFYEEEKIIHAYIHTFFCISMTRHLFWRSDMLHMAGNVTGQRQMQLID